MELGHGTHIVAQNRQLTHHIHACVFLFLRPEGHKLFKARVFSKVRISLYPPRRNAKPATMHLLKFCPNFFPWCMRLQQFVFLLPELIRIGGDGATNAMTWGTFKQYGLTTPNGFSLKTLKECPRGHSLFGKQVSRTHQDAKARSQIGKGCTDGCRNGCRQAIVDATSK